MSLANQLSEYVRACFTGLWIESHEHQDALAEIASLCRDEEWRLAVWDIADVLEFHAALLESGFPMRNVVLLHDDFEKLVAHYKMLGGDFKPKDYIPPGRTSAASWSCCWGGCGPTIR